jgi:hypothetical protein
VSKILNFIRPRWKAVMPLLVFVASALIDQYTSADAPAGWSAFGAAVVTSVLVYLKANTAPVLPAPAPAADAGEIGLSIIFRLLALACFIVVAVIGFDVVTSVYALGWLGLGLASWLLASFVA